MIRFAIARKITSCHPALHSALAAELHRSSSDEALSFCHVKPTFHLLISPDRSCINNTSRNSCCNLSPTHIASRTFSLFLFRVAKICWWMSVDLVVTGIRVCDDRRVGGRGCYLAILSHVHGGDTQSMRRRPFGGNIDLTQRCPKRDSAWDCSA